MTSIPPTNPLVLIVDDNPLVLDTLANILEDDGYVVMLAQNAIEAVAYLQRVLPDLVLSDISMPLIGGEQLCRQMRRDPRYAHIPVILMSANSWSPDWACGCAAFLPKPFAIHALTDTIDTVLRGKTARVSQEPQAQDADASMVPQRRRPQPGMDRLLDALAQPLAERAVGEAAPTAPPTPQRP